MNGGPKTFAVGFLSFFSPIPAVSLSRYRSTFRKFREMNHRAPQCLSESSMINYPGITDTVLITALNPLFLPESLGSAAIAGEVGG